MRPLGVDGNRVTYRHYESRFEAAQDAAQSHCAARGLYAQHERSHCKLIVGWTMYCMARGTCEECDSLFICNEQPPDPRRVPAPTTRDY